jgi:hypothetical protein
LGLEPVSASLIAASQVSLANLKAKILELFRTQRGSLAEEMHGEEVEPLHSNFLVL